MHKSENRRNKDSNKYEHGKNIIELERQLLRGILCQSLQKHYTLTILMLKTKKCFMHNWTGTIHWYVKQIKTVVRK